MKSRLVSAFASKRKTKTSPPRRRDRLRQGQGARLGLESLEARCLMAVVVPGSEHVTERTYQIAVDANAEPTIAGVTQSMSPAVSRAFANVSDLSRYTPAQLQSAREWVLLLSEDASVSRIAQELGGSSLRGTGIIEHTYVFRPATGQSVQNVIQKLRAVDGIEAFYPLVEGEYSKRAIPDDTLFPDQWHLLNTGQTGGTVGADVNVTNAWDDVRGEGVTIAIVDDGVWYTHPDLAPNYNTAIDFDFVDNDSDPFPGPFDNHGTAVAGLAGARGFNGIGVTGTGPAATLTGIRLIAGPFPARDLVNALALSYNNQEIDIYSNSWGPPDIGIPSDPTVFGGPLTLAAFENSVRDGRGGLGNIYTFAGGNGLQLLDNVNYDSLANSRFVIAVGALDHDGVQAFYSEPGAALLVAAPAGPAATPTEPNRNLTTTDNVGTAGYNFDPTGADGDPLPDLDYTSIFNGTSAATPVVSGIIALMLEANPSLTYRDVQHILVETARRNDPTDMDWMVNGAGYFVNHKYGFGLVDATAAVALAQNWETVNPEFSVSSGLLTPALPIPDFDQLGVTLPITINSDIDLSIEHVELRFSAPNLLSSDLEVVLTSPDGTRSVLAENRPTILPPGAYDDWSFNSVRHWGESVNGTWTVTVRDLTQGGQGVIEEVELIFYGTEEEDGEKIRGRKWNDIDADGVRDANEPGLAGFTFYVDRDNDGIFDPNEPSGVSDANGNYEIDVSALINQAGFGDYVVREVDRFGWDLTFPIADAISPVRPVELATVGDGFYVVTIDASDRIVAGVDFGNVGEPGEIHGVKWFDEDADGVRDLSEGGQPGVTIILSDDRGNEITRTFTDVNGAYSFEDLVPRMYVVTEVVPTGQTQTFPGASTNGEHRIDLQATQIRIDVDFGNFGQRGSISGRKFTDDDGDGVNDITELGVEGAIIYIDTNENGAFNIGEPSQVTDKFGYYTIPGLVPGEYIVREVIFDGTTQTTPGGDGSHVVTVFAGQDTSDVDFGNVAYFDFGDAPAPYPTLRNQGGASHGIRPGFFLGRRVDTDRDGQPNATATGDDRAGGVFSPGFSTPVGDFPVSAFVADLDSVRGPDVVVVNENSNTVSVLLNNSDGTFADAVDYAVGTDPSRVAAGDFDGDGDLDLVVTNSGSDNVTILENRGDGTFIIVGNEAAGMGPRGVTTGDVDRDGDIDIVISNFTSDTVSILLNDGMGDFATPLLVDVNEGPVADVALADVDRDNDLDLVAVNSASDSVSVILNLGINVDGDLTFDQPFDFIVGDAPQQVALADFNRDGRIDIATANSQGGSVSVLLNRGGGAFFPAQDFNVGGLPSSLSAADIDGDGDADLVVAARVAGSATLLVNNGNGVFSRGPDFVGGSIGVYVVTGDFNLDTGADVIFVNRFTDDITSFASAGDDEDGVLFSPQPLVRGRPASVAVTASAAGTLSAWLDYNRDGDWNDVGEQIIADQRLAAGTTTVFFTVPASASAGASFARFRFSDQLGLGPAGSARAGEVEDYLVNIAGAGGTPASAFTNPQNPLDVNADGLVTLNDVLVLINDLRANGIAHPVPTGVSPPPFIDPSGDGFVTLNDALLVINGLLTQMAANGEGEGEAVDAWAFDPASSSKSTLVTASQDSENRDALPAAPTAKPDVNLSRTTLIGNARKETASLVASAEEDWDDTLDAIADDVCSAWEKGFSQS